VFISSALNPKFFVGELALAAAAVLFSQVAAAGQTCVGDRAVKSSAARPAVPEELRERYGWLYHPVFAKLELARMLPELNDPPEKLRAPFRTKGDISFRLLIKNTSPESKAVILDSPYLSDRPVLYKDGVPVSYRQDALEKIRATDNPRREFSRLRQIGPGEQLTEIIDLGDWYEPLQPGRYELKVCRRFIWGGEWVETPPLTFDVVP
jgi:hypothetical protein